MNTLTKRMLLISLATLALGIGIQGLSHGQEPLQTEWQSVITDIRKKNKLIGVGGAILHEGKIVGIATDGVQIKGKTAPITNDDLWHLGSISKSMTATMIARLVEKDVISWDININDALKGVTIHPDWQGVSLENFLTHTSGAPANFPLLTRSIWPKTKDELRNARLKAISHILEQPPLSKPNEKFLYSNVGVTIAGVLAEQSTGKSWETLMREEVFMPLKMTSAGFGAPLSSATKSQPWGHRHTMAMKVPMNPEKRADNTPIMGPAGIIHMNMRDALKFGQVHLQGMKGKTDFLKPATFKRLHSPKLNNYGYGWVAPGTRKWADGDIIFHNGSNTMWYAMLIVAKEKDTVFILTSNDGDIKKAEKALLSTLPDFAIKLK